jgi:3-methyladenine DNA glycosylase AlkD
MPTRTAKRSTKPGAKARTQVQARLVSAATRKKPGAGATRATPRVRTTTNGGGVSLAEQLRTALEGLERKSTAHDCANLARFGITATRPYGVSMANVRVLTKELGKNHELAEALWATDRYEARMLACLVDEPERVTPAQMDRWCRDFDNWGITDTACFCLFDRVPAAWDRIVPWSRLQPEHSRRAAFALLASLALHDKQASDARFRAGLKLVEAGAKDERNFVKKGVLWALRGIGMRNAALHAAALETARRLAASSDPTARWVGKTGLRELTSPGVAKRLARAARARG